MPLTRPCFGPTARSSCSSADCRTGAGPPAALPRCTSGQGSGPVLAQAVPVTGVTGAARAVAARSVDRAYAKRLADRAGAGTDVVLLRGSDVVASTPAHATRHARSRDVAARKERPRPPGRPSGAGEQGFLGGSVCRHRHGSELRPVRQWNVVVPADSPGGSRGRGAAAHHRRARPQPAVRGPDRGRRARRRARRRGRPRRARCDRRAPAAGRGRTGWARRSTA